MFLFVQMKEEMDTMTVEQGKRRAIELSETDRHRSHFILDNPRDHIVLDAVGIFDENHNSSGEGSNTVSCSLYVAVFMYVVWLTGFVVNGTRSY